MSSPILEACGLSVSIAEKPVCAGLNLRIDAGQCWAIVGRNGVGKTTLLHTLAGLRAPDAGEIKLQGVPMTRLARRRVAQLLGVLPQTHHDAFPCSVLDNVLMGRHPHLNAWQWESNDDRAIARRALQSLGMEHFEQRSLDTLSGGERRRVGLAAVITQDPEVYLLDEPINHLDVHHQIQTLDLFVNATRAQRRAVIMVLHDINLVARFCDHVLLISSEGVTHHGTCIDLLNAKNLSQVFEHPMNQVQSPHGRLFIPS